VGLGLELLITGFQASKPDKTGGNLYQKGQFLDFTPPFMICLQGTEQELPAKLAYLAPGSLSTIMQDLIADGFLGSGRVIINYLKVCVHAP
jgi:hypothetical protein